MNVDPGHDEIVRFVGEDDGGPVVMLNLLRFKGEQGRSSYESYSEHVTPRLAAAGGTVLYAGECSTSLVAPEGPQWDMILLVRYPSRSAFLEMVKDPGYQEITHLRSDGLDAAVLLATRQFGA